MEVKRRIATGFAVALLVGAVFVGILGSILPAPLRTVLVGVETSVPTQIGVGVAVLVLVALGLVFLRTGSSEAGLPAPLVSLENPPERPSTPPAQTGAEFDDAVADAARAVRVEYVDPAETTPYERLHETAVSIVALGYGVEDSEAESIVGEGRWTDDSVAAGFLSATVEYPRLFRVFRWARPELAYVRAVSRTTQALHALAAAEIPGYVPTAKSIEGEHGGDAGRLRTAVLKLRRRVGLGRDTRQLGREAHGRPADTDGVASVGVASGSTGESSTASTQVAERAGQQPAEVTSDE